MTEVHADESSIKMDSITMSDNPSKNKVMNNGSHKIRSKSVTISERTASISESVIAKENLLTIKKEQSNSKQGNQFKISYLGLIIAMFLTIVVLQLPTVFYYTDPPSADVALLFDDINLESCTVS